MQRLAVALSAAALVVALLGTTPLGSAAEKTVKKVVRAGKAEQSSARGPRGKRGPRGPRGPRGFQGPPGEKGEPGLPDAYAVRSTSITVTGTTRETATSIATLASLPPGQYLVTAQVTASGTGSSRLACEGKAGAATGMGKSQVGDGPGEAKAATIAIVFGAPLALGGSVQLSCWLEERSAPDPIVTGDMSALRVGGLTQTP
ncbi:MAG TPA: hypothetical protein VFT86_09330 [Gaiellaceae bacterium]|nr:hypothetical protein [Gaiellaceae bacterium]